jgi:hypothetical protein
MVENITMGVDDTLEMDYIVKQISDDTIEVTSDHSTNSYSINYLNKQVGVFDPMETGTYKLDINGQTIEIEVTDIPDSEADSKLLHRWHLSEDSAPFVDQIGGADSTNVVGTTQVTGDWIDGAARDADGTDDYIETTNLGSFGSNMDTDFALAFSIQTTDNSLASFGGTINGVNATFMFASIGSISDANAGELAFSLNDSNDNEERVYVDGTRYDDGNPYRVVINKTSNSASDIEFWTNQSQQTTSVDRSEGFSSPTDFTAPFLLFARSFGGADTCADTILDDFCIFGDSLTQTEIQSYTNPWS